MFQIYKMHSRPLPKFEVYFYFCSWIFGIMYSSYHVYLIGNKLSHSFEQNLNTGWSFLNRKKDNADEEWKLWTDFILNILSKWIIVHHIGACVIAYFNSKILPIWYVILTASCVIYNYGLNNFVVFFIQPTIYVVLLSLTRSRIIIWIFTCIVYYVFIHEDMIWFYSVRSEKDLDVVIPTLMWIYLRCISFCLDKIDKKLDWVSIYTFYGYVFYLPCFFLGPILLFDVFSNKLYKTSWTYTYRSLMYLIIQNIRYLFWLFLTEFILHFVYINCLLYYIEVLKLMKFDNVWVMYGVGFCMGQFFFLKYTVVYGLALTWTKAEGYETPNPPRCIAHICLYSDMWRYFDEGLYLFIRRYLYDPCFKHTFPSSFLQKMMYTFLCFVFIFIWHGMNYPVFMWSLLNFCGIVIETIARSISKLKYYNYFKNRIGSRNERRFVGIICSPLTIISAISNFYFLGGPAVAETYFSYIFKNGMLSNTLCLWFFVYCLCQVSIELKSVRKPYQRLSGSVYNYNRLDKLVNPRKIVRKAKPQEQKRS